MKTIYLIIDNDFNRTWYPDIIGQVFITLCGYAHVRVYYIDNGILYENLGTCLTEVVPGPELDRGAHKFGYTGPISSKVDQFHSYNKQARRETITAHE